MNLPRQTRFDWPTACALFLSPVLFSLVWLMMGKPIYPWDSAWYRMIVDKGYSFDGDITNPQNIAFLPGYPIVIKCVSTVCACDTFLAQQITCFLGCFVGIGFFHKVFASRLGEVAAGGVVVFWTLMPFSIYFMNGYSESILFALSGASFYLLDKNRFVPACLLISYGLITRPHAIALIPVLFYTFYRLEHSKMALPWYRASLKAGVKMVEFAPVIFIFPFLLTLYWYFSFGDSLVYKNILYAWQSGPELTIFLKVKAIREVFLSIFQGEQYSLLHIGEHDFSLLSPQQFAVLLFFAGCLATPLFLMTKHYDYFFFHITMIAFWFVSSCIENMGRHVSSLFVVPFTGVACLIALRSRIEAEERTRTRFLLGCIAAFLSFGLTVILGASVLYFICYSIRYLDMLWVS